MHGPVAAQITIGARGRQLFLAVSLVLLALPGCGQSVGVFPANVSTATAIEQVDTNRQDAATPEPRAALTSPIATASVLAAPHATESVLPDCPRLDRALRRLVAADDAARFAETNGLDLENGLVAISIALTGADGDLAEQYGLEDPVLFFTNTPRARMQARARIERLCDLSRDSRVGLVSAIPRIVNPVS